MTIAVVEDRAEKRVDSHDGPAPRTVSRRKERGGGSSNNRGKTGTGPFLSSSACVLNQRRNEWGPSVPAQTDETEDFVGAFISGNT